MLRLFHISLFRHEQNVHNILSKRVKDISKQYLLILYIIVRWKNKRDIFMISTKHLAEMVEVRKNIMFVINQW